MSDVAPALSIRTASASERAAIGKIWAGCGLTTSYNDPASDFDFAHDKPNSTVLVGLVADRIVASLMVGHDGHRGWLYYVSVDPGAQGNGYGAAIVGAGEDWLRQRGVPKVMLMIRETNARVTAFYEHIGYETAPRIVMQKWL